MGLRVASGRCICPDPDVRREITQQLARCRQHERRPRDFREVLEEHARQNGGDTWLRAATTDAASNTDAQMAVRQAADLFLEHAKQQQRDSGRNNANNIEEKPAQQGYRGARWEAATHTTLYAGTQVVVKGVDGKQRTEGRIGLGNGGTVEEGELSSRIERTERLGQTGDNDLLPQSLPVELVLSAATSTCAAGRRDPPTPPIWHRCDQITEVDRILRARSPFGILGTPADGPPLSTARVGALFEASIQRLGRAHRRHDAKHLRQAEQRLETARQQLMNTALQARLRAEWCSAGSRVTSTHICPVHVAALEAFACTDAAEEVPTNKHGESYGASCRELDAPVTARR